MTAPPRLLGLAADRRGVSAVTTALALGAVLGVVALGLDGAAALRLHARLQASADAAALAGATALADGVAAGPLVDALVAENMGAAPVTVRVQAQHPRLSVMLEVERRLLFPQLLGLERMAIAAEATATAPRLGPACLLALGVGARPIAGTGLARLDGCTTLSVADGLSPARLAALNPFAPAPVSQRRCRPGTHLVAHSEVLGPGQALPAYCGGTRVVAGGRLLLEGGAFDLSGPLLVEPGGQLETRQAVILAGAHPVRFEPGADIALVPPRTGPHAGVVLLGAPAGSAGAVSQLRAGARQALGGAVVLPAQTVELAGNAAACGLVVAQAIRISARTRLGLDCPPPLPRIVARQARLVG